MDITKLRRILLSFFWMPSTRPIIIFYTFLLTLQCRFAKHLVWERTGTWFCASQKFGQEFFVTTAVYICDVQLCIVYLIFYLNAWNFWVFTIQWEVNKDVQGAHEYFCYWMTMKMDLKCGISAHFSDLVVDFKAVALNQTIKSAGAQFIALHWCTVKSCSSRLPKVLKTMPGPFSMHARGEGCNQSLDLIQQHSPSV